MRSHTPPQAVYILSFLHLKKLQKSLTKIQKKVVYASESNSFSRVKTIVASSGKKNQNNTIKTESPCQIPFFESTYVKKKMEMKT